MLFCIIIIMLQLSKEILILFCIIIIMLQVLENFGFKKIGGKIFSDIAYADDISLITCTHDEMSIFLERLHIPPQKNSV